MPGGRYPWAVRAGGPLLGGGGGLPTVFFWDPANNGPLPASASFIRVGIARYFDGVGFVQVADGVIRDEHVAIPGADKGYLSEPLATNQVVTVDLTDVAWAKDNLVPITDNGINILNLNEYKIESDTSGGSHGVQQTVAAGSAGVAWFLAKADTIDFITASKGSGAADDYAAADVKLGEITQEGAGIDNSYVQSSGNGWYKVVVNSVDAGDLLILGLSTTPTPGVRNFSFVGTDEAVLYAHSQHEATPFDTTPIVTSGTPLTRNADVLDTGATIDEEFGALLDLTLPVEIGAGETISLLGASAAPPVDILRVNDTLQVIMDDGATPVVLGVVVAGTRNKISYGRDATGRSGSLNGATAVTGAAPSAAHEGQNFQLGATNSVNQSRCTHHLTSIYEDRPTDAELEQLAAPPPPPVVTQLDFNPVSGGGILSSSTFSRSTIGLYFDGTEYVQAAIDEPRFQTFPTVPRHFLREPRSTNQITDVDIRTWSQDNASTSLVGTNTIGLVEYRITPNSGFSSHGVQKNAATGAAGVGWWILKREGARFATISKGSGAADDFACIDLLAAEVTQEGAGIDGSCIFPLSDDYLICIVDSVDAGDLMVLGISDTALPGVRNVSFDDVALTLLVCHAQYEPSVTSPIVTTGTIATRQADILTDEDWPVKSSADVDLTIPCFIGPRIPMLGFGSAISSAFSVDDASTVRLLNDGIDISTTDAFPYEESRRGFAMSLEENEGIVVDDEGNDNIDSTGTVGQGLVYIGSDSDNEGQTAWIHRVRVRNITQTVSQLQSNITPQATVTTLVFLIAGQSNSHSGATLADSDAIPVDGIFQWGRFSSNDGKIIKGYENLQHETALATNIGFGTYFAKPHRVANPTVDILLVPAGVANTGFNNNEWNQGDSKYNDAVARTNAAIAAAENASIGGILWHQGELDADAGLTEVAYAAALDAMVAAMRVDITGANATTPFVLGSLADAYISANPGLRQPVQDAIIDTPDRLSDCALADATGLIIYDTLHFDATSQRTFGQRYYDAFITI